MPSVFAAAFLLFFFFFAVFASILSFMLRRTAFASLAPTSSNIPACAIKNYVYTVCSSRSLLTFFRL